MHRSTVFEVSSLYKLIQVRRALDDTLLIAAMRANQDASRGETETEPATERLTCPAATSATVPVGVSTVPPSRGESTIRCAA